MSLIFYVAKKKFNNKSSNKTRQMINLMTWLKTKVKIFHKIHIPVFDVWCKIVKSQNSLRSIIYPGEKVMLGIMNHSKMEFKSKFANLFQLFILFFCAIVKGHAPKTLTNFIEFYMDRYIWNVGIVQLINYIFAFILLCEFYE